MKRFVLTVAALIAATSLSAKPKDGETVLKWDFYSRETWPCEGGTASIPLSVGDQEFQAKIRGAAHSFLAKGAAGGTLRIQFANHWSYSHPDMGTRIKGVRGDYLEVPGIPGKCISTIFLEIAGDNQVRPQICDLQGKEIAGGAIWEDQTRAGDTHLWTLSGTKAGMPCRITHSRNGEAKYGRIEITYLPASVSDGKAAKPKKLLIELPFRSTTNLEGDTIFELPANAAGVQNAGQTISTKLETKYGFEMWSQYGFARNTGSGGQTIECLCVNRGGRTAGGEMIGGEGYAWIKTPAIPGKTLKQVVVVCTKGQGKGLVNLSSSVDSQTGKGGCEFTSDTAFSINSTQYFNACGAREGESCYICFSNASNLGVEGIDLYYE